MIQAPAGYTVCHAAAKDPSLTCSGTLTGSYRTADDPNSAHYDGLHWYMVVPKPSGIGAGGCWVEATIVVEFIRATPGNRARRKCPASGGCLAILPSIADAVPWLLSCVIALAIMLPDGFFYERSEAQVPHQFRTRNDLTKTKRTRSNSRESIGKSTKLTILPLITVWPQVRVLPGPPIFACSASYGSAGHPVSRARYRRSRLCARSGRGGLPHCRARTAGRQ